RRRRRCLVHRRRGGRRWCRRLLIRRRARRRVSLRRRELDFERERREGDENEKADNRERDAIRFHTRLIATANKLYHMRLTRMMMPWTSQRVVTIGSLHISSFYNAPSFIISAKITCPFSNRMLHATWTLFTLL